MSSSKGHRMSAAVAAALAAPNENACIAATEPSPGESHGNVLAGRPGKSSGEDFLLDRSRSRNNKLSNSRRSPQHRVKRDKETGKTERSPPRRHRSPRRQVRSRSRSNEKKKSRHNSMFSDMGSLAPGAPKVSSSVLRLLGDKVPVAARPEPQSARLLPKVAPPPPKWTPAEEEAARKVVEKQNAKSSGFSDTAPTQEMQQEQLISPLQAEIARYIKVWGIHGGVASMLNNQTPEIQRAVLDLGPLAPARNPSGLLVDRILRITRGAVTGVAYTPRQ